MTLLMRDQENIEIGMEKGTLKERRKIITKMLYQGFNDEQIMSVCETSEEEINECKKICMQRSKRYKEVICGSYMQQENFIVSFVMGKK